VNLPVTLSLASVSEEVTVEAEADTSIAAQLSPVKSVLDAASARTEITSQYVSEFTSPVTDFADITQAAPGTVSWSSNGIGMGQAKIYFCGFKDDDYTMTWDGIPFEDANDPSHHSWAYVPAPAIGYVDFDRSPGTTADMGPANYGGSIHMFFTATARQHVDGRPGVLRLVQYQSIHGRIQFRIVWRQQSQSEFLV
jgi:iron complex outermembrane recepter protein